jgi:hypothetical protein
VATDGSLETAQNLTITVNNVNRAPYFEDRVNLVEVNEKETVEPRSTNGCYAGTI